MTEAPRLVWEVGEGGSRLGALVIDRPIAGRACGGVRVAPVIETEELRDLAATMTLKFAFLGIACGGAKAGFAVPAGATAAERCRRAQSLGRALAPFLRPGAYIAGTDMGSDEADLWEMRNAAGLSPGPAPTAATSGTSATASYSGRSAAVAALAALGRSATGATLGIAGYGRVGAALAERFVAAGGRLVAAATAAGAVIDPAGLDVARLEALRAVHGDAAPLHYPGARHARSEEILAVPVDVLAPCASRHMLDERTAAGVRAHIVAPGANAALTPGAEVALAAAGVLVLPDFVTSAGGVLVSHFWPLDPPREAAARLIEGGFRALVAALLASAARANERPAELARRLAYANLERLDRVGVAGLRHERILSRLGRRRFRRLLPARVRTTLVTWLARALEPAVAPAT